MIQATQVVDDILISGLVYIPADAEERDKRTAATLASMAWMGAISNWVYEMYNIMTAEVPDLTSFAISMIITIGTLMCIKFGTGARNRTYLRIASFCNLCIALSSIALMAIFIQTVGFAKERCYECQKNTTLVDCTDSPDDCTVFMVDPWSVVLSSVVIMYYFTLGMLTSAVSGMKYYRVYRVVNPVVNPVIIKA